MIRQWQSKFCSGKKNESRSGDGSTEEIKKHLRGSTALSASTFPADRLHSRSFSSPSRWKTTNSVCTFILGAINLPAERSKKKKNLHGVRRRSLTKIGRAGLFFYGTSGSVKLLQVWASTCSIRPVNRKTKIMPQLRLNLQNKTQLTSHYSDKMLHFHNKRNLQKKETTSSYWVKKMHLYLVLRRKAKLKQISFRKQ